MRKDHFFSLMEALGLALSYDDVRLKTGHSGVLPSEAILATKFSRNVAMNCPITSAAMDTVTESRMAIAMAQAGGIGVIHRKLEPKDQVREVRRVKFFLNGRIEKPICVLFNDTIRAIRERKEHKRWPFHSFPVLDGDGNIAGILTQDDFEFCMNDDLRAADIMTAKPVTAPDNTNLETAFEIMQKAKKKVLPLVDNSNKVVGMYTFSDVKRIKMGNAKDFSLDKNGHLRAAASIGTGNDALIRAELLVAANVDVLVIDTAHGDTDSAIRILRELKNKFPGTDVVAGNISEGEAAKRLVDAGADGVKVGQGPGSICTTRIVAGIGCPQVTAIYNCAKAIEGSGVPVCADGGIKYSGDITVAVGAGAHCVMLGKLLAGAEEAPGEFVNYHGVRCKVYRGMGSLSSMLESIAARERYNQLQQEIGRNKLVPEGIDGVVPCEGPVAEMLVQYLGGLRSGMGYVGAATIEELREKGDFYRISAQGLAESHPHGVLMTADAPNYKKGAGK